MDLRDIFDKMRSGESTPEGDEIKQRADASAAKNDAYAPRDPKTGDKLPQEEGLTSPQEIDTVQNALLAGNPMGALRGTAGNVAMSGIRRVMDKRKADVAAGRSSAVQQDVIRDPEMAQLASKPGGADAIAAGQSAANAENKMAFNKFQANNEKYTSPDTVKGSSLNYSPPTTHETDAKTLDYSQMNSTKSNTDSAPSLNYKDILAADAAKKASMKNIRKPD